MKLELEVDYLPTIEQAAKAIADRFAKPKLWANDEEVVQLFTIYYKAIYAQIHLVLSPIGLIESEKQIRDIIAKYVIGYIEGKSKKQYIGAITPIKSKIYQIKERGKIRRELVQRYLELYDDFLALAAFRSFKHYALYIEKHLNSGFDAKIGTNGGDTRIIEHTMPLFEGWYYYAGKMVLDGAVQFICKQMPTSYGKSYGDVLLITFIFGYNIDNDVIKVFGNPHNCTRCIESIVDIMCRKCYAKVFPYYAQFDGKPRAIFTKLNRFSGEMKITGSSHPINFLCVGKDSKISGVRGKYIFLDDITQAEDKDVLSKHQTDIADYNNVWKKRTYGKNNCYIIAGGTAYSIYDLISYLKSKFGFHTSVQSKLFKYTTVAKSGAVKANGTSVFITVPKLDYKTDESTYPEEFDTETAKAERREDYDTFMAMEQQMPVSPKNTPFYYTNLQEYDDLPKPGTNGRASNCVATLDGKRKGADFCAMPIGCKIGEDMYAIIDCVYDNRPMEECYSSIISKIIQHNITELYVESNINEGLPLLLQKMLEEQGYYSCKISEVFSYERKDDRIAANEATIKSRLRFPCFGMYTPTSQMGAALQEMYTYSYVARNVHDDFTDALANFCRCYITQKREKLAKVSWFNR